MSIVINMFLLYMFIMWTMTETIAFSQDSKFMLEEAIKDGEGGFGILFLYIFIILISPVVLYKCWR